MVLLLKMIYQGYLRYNEENRERQLDNYFLMGSPLKIILLTAFYWHFVMKSGQRFMKNRQPFDLKIALLVYNAFQIIANCYIVYLTTLTVIGNSFYSDWSCMRATKPQASYNELHGYYCYFLLKVSDYMDTIFMVLRKRNRQVTFLHVYHHILMVFSTYYVALYVTGGQCIMLGYVNGFVHIVMYAYYFMAALRPGLRNSSTWKKHITHMQLAQFLYLIYHFGRAILNKNCNEPMGISYFGLIQSIVMVGLFSDFYYKAYCKPLKKAKNEKIEN